MTTTMMMMMMFVRIVPTTTTMTTTTTMKMSTSTMFAAISREKTTRSLMGCRTHGLPIRSCLAPSPSCDSPYGPSIRFFSGGNDIQTNGLNGSSGVQPPRSTDASNWRKQQLDKLEKKFDQDEADDEPQNIRTEDELQPMWKDMESRVTRRRSLTLTEAQGKVGRRNVRRTDEEAWLQAGLYDEHKDEGENENNDSPTGTDDKVGKEKDESSTNDQDK